MNLLPQHNACIQYRKWGSDSQTTFFYVLDTASIVPQTQANSGSASQHHCSWLCTENDIPRRMDYQRCERRFTILYPLYPKVVGATFVS